jgi:hypothetical protein
LHSIVSNSAPTKDKERLRYIPCFFKPIAWRGGEVERTVRTQQEERDRQSYHQLPSPERMADGCEEICEVSERSPGTPQHQPHEVSHVLRHRDASGGAIHDPCKRTCVLDLMNRSCSLRLSLTIDMEMLRPVALIEEKAAVEMRPTPLS